MTRLTIICISLITISFMLTFQCSAKIDPKTVVGLWLFDEGTGTTVKDSSGNGHDGEIVGDVKWTTEGKFENALSFPGDASSLVTIPHDDSMNLITMTLTAWIKISELPDSIAPIYKIQPDNVRNYQLRVYNSNKMFALEFSSTPGNWIFAQAKTTVVDGKWHHIAGTYDKKVLLVYVDGVKEGQKSFSDDPDFSPGPILLGARSTKGLLDDVGIFNEALSEADIKKIMN